MKETSLQNLCDTELTVKKMRLSLSFRKGTKVASCQDEDGDQPIALKELTNEIVWLLRVVDDVLKPASHTRRYQI